MEFRFIGFRETQTQHYGAECSVCQDTMERWTKCMYNPMTKEFRHFRCHVNHPANLCELWLADKTETNEETFEPITRRTVIITNTMSIETARVQFTTNGITLIERLEAFPKGTKNPVEVRRRFLESLGKEVSPRAKALADRSHSQAHPGRRKSGRPA